jgi:hypothetical protein
MFREYFLNGVDKINHQTMIEDYFNRLVKRKVI